MDGNVREKLLVAAGAVVAVLLQVALAPHIAVGAALPNFIMAFALAAAVARPAEAGLALPFALGLVYDLLGNGPVGAMAFLLVLASFAVASAFQVLDNDSPFMPVLTLALAVLAVEVLYAVFMLAAGVEAGVMEALAYRALPCALYDAVAGAVLYVVLSRLLAGGQRAKFGQTRF